MEREREKKNRPTFTMSASIGACFGTAFNLERLIRPSTHLDNLYLVTHPDTKAINSVCKCVSVCVHWVAYF